MLIDWQKVGGLLPVVVQEHSTKEVLMLAYMNKEALDLTLSSGLAHYFSRTKNRIWQKGESSGYTQEVQGIRLDCDGDTLLLLVKQNGVACHTGRKSCFFRDLSSGESISKPSIKTDEIYGVVDALYHTILEKKSADPSKSWSAKLLNSDDNVILKKVIEEAGEFSFAYKDDDHKEIVYEAADLFYHTLVALAKKQISPDLVRQELRRRTAQSGIEEKNSRSK